MLIRPYEARDEDALLSLERQSPRGFPEPFIHFRRRFIARSELYHQFLTLVTEDAGEVVGVSSVALKQVYLMGEQVTLAYSYDTRVHPRYRHQGLGYRMVQEKLIWAREQGAVGVYSLIVATNHESLGMVAKSGYQKVKMVLHLEFQPAPLFEALACHVYCDPRPLHQDEIRGTYWSRDFFTTEVAQAVQGLDFQRWYLNLATGQPVGFSVYNQAPIYTKIPAEMPYPRTPEAIQRLGRNLQIFDVIGWEQAEALHCVFQVLRDEAVATQVNKISWLVDRNELLPSFIFDEVAHQTDYWLMYRSFLDAPPIEWSPLLYLDPRDL